MSDQATLTAETSALQLDTLASSGEIEIAGPDKDGDFEIYLYGDGSTRYISTSSATRLRDWLNKVLP